MQTPEELRAATRQAFIELYRHDLAGRILEGYNRGQTNTNLSLFIKYVLDEIGPLLGRYFDAANPQKTPQPPRKDGAK